LDSQTLQNISQQALVLPVLIQLAAIVMVAPLMANIAVRLKQPAAVGWIVAGILMGPSFLGKYFPLISQCIFSLDQLGYASAESAVILPHVFFILAEIGLILLLFITGVEHNFSHLKNSGKSAAVIAIAGIVVPFLLGITVAYGMHPYVASNVSLLGFCLFVGICMSITALPILGKLMMELGISRTRLAAVTISAGATGDAVGWMMLAVVAAIVKSELDLLEVLKMIGAALIFLACMFFIAKPILSQLILTHLKHNQGKLGRDALAYLLVFVIVCSIVTHLIGIFALFGAFLAGAILSKIQGLREAVKAKLQDIVDILFLPIFFTYTGIHTDINSFNSLILWALFSVILLAAVAGKLGGCYLAARCTGFSKRESLCIGSMMNCRALMELIAVNIGATLGVIPDSVYTMLVFMALITTVMTTPLLYVFKDGTELEQPMRDAGFFAK
jgi:Kef-type K+ transport system membrane component KefB